MATLLKRKSKKTGKMLYTVQVVLNSRRRPCVPIGPVTKAAAQEAMGYIAQLAVCRRSNTTIGGKTAAWLADVDEDFYAVLVDRGLCDPRQMPEPAPLPEVPTLATFLDSYIAKRADVKDGTAVVYGHTRRCLVEFFGAHKPLVEISPADADDWRRWLGLAKDEDDPKAGGQGLGDNTVRRRCGIARQFFRDAVRRRLITESPFGEMQGVVVRSNRTRDYFITRVEAAVVIKACPDEQWKLLFALSRYGGFRCPSEHLALHWGDVDFAAGKITVHSSKTEHHEGKGIRVMPLFPELRPHLEAVRNELVNAPGFDPKITPISKLPVITRYRESNINLRTQLCKIIRRAGLTPWPKLFQNLRATRATELADQFATHVAADWLGHSTTIADKHYRQTTAEHFARALHPALQSPAESDGSGGNERNEENEKSLDVQKNRILLIEGVGDTGLEPVTSAV